MRRQLCVSEHWIDNKIMDAFTRRFSKAISIWSKFKGVSDDLTTIVNSLLKEHKITHIPERFYVFTFLAGKNRVGRYKQAPTKDFFNKNSYMDQ
jgi:hypothetical protein